MKKTMLAMICFAGAFALQAAPLRVAVLDFTDQTGQQADARLGGAVAPGAMAAKGEFLLGKQIVSTNIVLIDRRDLFAQMARLEPKDMGRLTPAKPSFIQAAQMLRADAVLRGTIMSLSTGKQKINQGGYASEMDTLTIRVGIEALDPVDGSVIAMVDGRAEQSFRQTDAVSTELGEDDVLSVFEEAIHAAVPEVVAKLEAQADAMKNRPMVKLDIKTDADPALVEVDGVLVGSTPLDGFDVYKGDHILSIGKPGYQQITKRILLEKDTAIEAPMFKTKLSADQLKEVLEKAQLNGFFGNIEPGLIIKSIDSKH